MQENSADLEDKLLAQYEAELTEIEKRGETLKGLMNGLRARRGLEPLTFTAKPGEENIKTGISVIPLNGKTYLGMKLKDAIKHCLKVNHRLMKAKEIIKDLEDGQFYSEVKNFRNAVSVELQKMKDREEVFFNDKNQWGLIEWRGGKSKNTKEAEKIEEKEDKKAEKLTGAAD